MARRSGAPGHVAIVTSNFRPEQTGISCPVTEFAEYLAAAGIAVKVVTALPYYPEWRIASEYRGRLWKTERDGNIQVLRSWHYVRPRPSSMTRLLHEITLSLFALPRLIGALRGATAAYVVSPDLGFAFVGMFVALLLRVRRVLVVEDVMPDAAVELGMVRSRWVIATARALARLMYRWADEIHTLGEGMRRRIARETATPAKIRIVPITIDAAELDPVPVAENAFRRRFVPEGTLAVLHTGNMGQKQDLQLLLRAARRLQGDSAVHFYVFGDGAAKDDFLRVRDGWGLRNVSHHPLQERWMLRHMLSGADLVLVSQLAEVVDIVVPSKLITALGAGAMIVAACAPDSETAGLIRGSESGLVIPPGDDAALVDVIERVRARAVDTDAFRRRAREFALQNFLRAKVYSPLVRALASNSVVTDRWLEATGSVPRRGAVR